MKNILTIWGNKEQGKSTTIKKIVPLFQAHFPYAKLRWIHKDYDIELIIELKDKKIGIESQGDPGSRLEESVSYLATEEKCDLIICASRTRGKTVDDIVRIAQENNYEIIWVNNYRSNSNHKALNEMSAEHIFQLILTLI